MITSMGELRPGDTYADADGNPVADELASYGGRPIGAIPRPWIRFIPLTVASVTPAKPLGGMPAVYVEASNGHGATVRADMRTRIMPRSWGRYAITETAHGWRWTYSDITRADAETIADTLTRPGETWTVTRISY